MSNWKEQIVVSKLATTSNVNMVLSDAISVYRQIPPPKKERLRELIEALVRADELSFMEHCNITFKIEGITSIGLRHLVRHRIASYSVESQRYVKRFGKYCVATPNEGKYNGEALRLLKEHILNGYKLYHNLINNHKWKKSYARFAVSSCDCHSVRCTFNFRSLRNFIKLRHSNKAQEEIRHIAIEMLLIAHKLQPSVFGDLFALLERKDNGLQFK